MQFVFYYPSRDTEKKINTGNTDRFRRYAFSFNFESFPIRFTIISTCCLISIDEMEEEGGNPKFTTPIVEFPFPFWKSAPPLYPHSSTRETRRRRARNSVSSTDLRTLALLSAYTGRFTARLVSRITANENENSRHLRDFPIPFRPISHPDCNRIFAIIRRIRKGGEIFVATTNK